MKLSPLVKWPGGKRLLLREILPIIGEDLGRYFEPFLGGGAVFLAVEPKKAFLSDSNPDLINLYKQVRDKPQELIERLGELRNSEADYYKIRETIESDEVRSAARLMYLTSLSFNGIYRLNLRGQFNVPYGQKPKKQHFNSTQIMLISNALRETTLSSQDFESAVKSAKSGDTVYFDPPYTVAHGNNGFLKYNEKIFSWSDQVRLAEVFRKLDRRGCRVLVSNAAHDSVKDLYSKYEIIAVQRASLIGASKESRKPIFEYLIHNT